LTQKNPNKETHFDTARQEIIKSSRQAWPVEPISPAKTEGKKGGVSKDIFPTLCTVDFLKKIEEEKIKSKTFFFFFFFFFSSLSLRTGESEGEKNVTHLVL
jgi:hypothetical protein